MKLLEYHPLTVEEALQNFMGEFDELLFEEDRSDYRLSRIVNTYCELKTVMAQDSLNKLRNALMAGWGGKFDPVLAGAKS